jgi:hypothetical protein
MIKYFRKSLLLPRLATQVMFLKPPKIASRSLNSYLFLSKPFTSSAHNKSASLAWEKKSYPRQVYTLQNFLLIIIMFVHLNSTSIYVFVLKNTRQKVDFSKQTEYFSTSVTNPLVIINLNTCCCYFLDRNFFTASYWCA